MEIENGNSSAEDELNHLKNKENESDDDSDDSVDTNEDAKDVGEIRQALSESESDLEETDESEDDEESEEIKNLPARTYIPVKGKKDDDLVVDESAYVLLCKSKTNYPCMSFDIIHDNDGEGEDRSSKFPISLSMIGGTYSGKRNADSLIVMKFSKLYPNSKNSKLDNDDSTNQMITEQSRTDKEGATLRFVKLPHQGSINRVRCKNLNNTTYCSSWSENGNVYLWNLSKALKAIKSDKLMNEFNAKSASPLFTFKGI